ncbi:MAG: glycosyltransferase family 1 protein [Bryobacteraceae bacterium]
MKIALDATYSVGEELSGVAVYSRSLLFGMAEAHADIRFLFCYRANRFVRALSTTLPANCRRALLQEPFLPRDADLFHGLNQRLPRGKLRRTVTTFHDLFVLTGDYSTPEFRRRFTEQARHAAMNSDRIIAVSHFTAGQVRELLGVDPERIRVVHHGLGWTNIPSGGTREKLILHVGAIQRRKNLSRLVTAFETAPPEWRLVLAGSSGFGAEEILKQIGSSPAGGRIEVTGYISRERLADYYSRAMIFAFPSLDEGFGIPVLEAMAAGVPVLTSNRSALLEVAGDAAILVDPEDQAAITEALQKLCRDEETRARLAAAGKGRIGDFSWDRAVEQTWQVYRELFVRSG